MWNRVWAIVTKELRQLSRDRMSFGLIVMIPLIQLKIGRASCRERVSSPV